jgi:hypothetical protein
MSGQRRGESCLELAAREIADGKPPVWLLEFLGENVPQVWTARIIETHRNKLLAPRKTARAKFEKWQNDTTALADDIDGIGDYDWLSWLVIAGYFEADDCRKTSEFVAALRDLAAKAKTLAGDKSLAGGGAHRAVPRPHGLSARDICAAVVIAAWQRLRGKRAGTAAYPAADEFWQEAGGASGGSEDIDWRRHFQRARSQRHSLTWRN